MAQSGKSYTPAARAAVLQQRSHGGWMLRLRDGVQLHYATKWTHSCRTRYGNQQRGP
jgi:hypothetical protein